jgi:hypothetical protein
MKNKIVKYMINMDMNPAEFADLVNLGAEIPPQNALNTNQEEKSISIFDIILLCAIIIVGVFLAAIFL